MGAIIRSAMSPVNETFFREMLAVPAVALDARAFHVLADHAQAIAMIEQDRLNGGQDAEWSAFFVESMVEFLVWSRAPAGNLAAEDMRWLEAQLAGPAFPSAPALLFALVRELNAAPERLTALALRHAGNRRAGLH